MLEQYNQKIKSSLCSRITPKRVVCGGTHRIAPGQFRTEKSRDGSEPLATLR